MRADRRIYTNADKSKVVDENSPEASILLAAEGDDIADEDVRRLGLMGKPKAKPAAPDKAEEKPAAVDDKVEEKPESKAVENPPENKAQTMPSKKAPESK